MSRPSSFSAAMASSSARLRRANSSGLKWSAIPSSSFGSGLGRGRGAGFAAGLQELARPEQNDRQDDKQRRDRRDGRVDFVAQGEEHPPRERRPVAAGNEERDDHLVE